MAKLLIVDDEKDVVLVLKDFFVSKGHRVLTAFNGTEAMKLLKEESINLILLDIQMPDINGIDILKEIKKKDASVKTVVLTGFSDEYKEEIERIGCDAFLTKPFSINTLISVVESLLVDKREDLSEITSLINDNKILAKAKLLFIEPNEIMYSAKAIYFKDVDRCKGQYSIEPAFREEQIVKKLDEFRPDIVISNINMFQLYKVKEKISKLAVLPKDVILYGITDAGIKDASFITGLFDPVLAVVKPKEMDRLGQIVRSTAIAHNLYIKRDSL